MIRHLLWLPKRQLFAWCSL